MLLGGADEVSQVFAPSFSACGLQEINGSGEAVGAGQVLRSGFETGRRVDELRAGEVGADAVDHAAAEHQWRHLPQVLRADVEHADAIGSEDFMTRKGQKVAAERLDVYGLMVHGLGAIDQGGDVGGAGARADLLHWQ